MCICVCFLLKDLFISSFFSFKPVDREIEADLRGSYCINTMCSALPCDFYCTLISLLLHLFYQVKGQCREIEFPLQH